MLRSIELHNVGAHEHLLCELGPGLNVIVGPNGSGKSTIVKAAYASLTNDWKRFDGTKEDNVRQGTPRGQRSSVKTVLEHRGLELAVERLLAGTSRDAHRLAYGGQAVAGEKAVNAKVAELLGVSDWVLSELLFVRQGGVCDLMQLTAAKRSERFQYLFGLAAARSAWKLLGEDAAAVRARLPDGGAAFLEQEVHRLEGELATLDHELLRMTEDGCLDRPAADLQACLAARAGLRECYAAVERLSRQRLDAEQELRGLKEREAVLAEDGKVLAEAVGGEQQAADQARAELARLRQAAAVGRSLDRLRQERQRTQEAALQRTAPQRPLEYMAVELEPELALARKEAAERRRFLDKFDPRKGRLACPECGQDAESLRSRWEELVALEERDGPRLAEAESQWQYSRAFDQAVRDYTAEQEQHRQNLERLDRQIAELGGLTMAAVGASEAELQQQIAAAEQVAAALRQVQQELQELARPLAQAEERLRGLQAERRRLEERRLGYEAELARTGVPATLTDADVEAARLLRVRYDEALARRELAERAVTAARGRLDQALAREQGRTRGLAYAERRERQRRYFAHDALPAAVVRHNLARVVLPTNRLLAELEMPFQVQVEGDLEAAFMAVKDTGERHPVGRLSDGELLAMSLALLLALAEQFAGALGFIVLDEPTQNLDRARILALTRLLDKLRLRAADRGAQVVVVTHERELIRSADRVLDLSVRGAV